MFKNTFLAAVTIAGLAVASPASVAFAGGYGYGHGSGYSGHGGGYHKGGYYQRRDRASYHGKLPRHVNWCHGRYKTYRAQDNTYQPYSGPRQPCLSPYFKG